MTALQPSVELSSRLIPHLVEMSNNRHICIQKSIHTILRAGLLVLIQLPTPNRARYAFLPADIGEGVDGYMYT